MRLIRAAMSLAASALALAATPVFAQRAVDAPTAADDTGDQGRSGDVVVTGERVTRSLLDTLPSVTVIPEIEITDSADSRAWFVGGKLAQDVGPGTLKLLVGWNDEDYRSNVKRASSGITDFPSSDSLFSAEALYSLDLAAVSGVAGVSYAKRRFGLNANAFGFLDLATNTDTQTYAVYADLRVRLADRIELNLGGRILHTRQVRDFAFGAPVIVDERTSFDAVLTQLGVLFRPTAHQSIGATLRRGYLEGGRSPDLVTFTSYTFGAEKVWTAEAVYRLQSADGRYGLAVTGLYNWYRDYQANVQISNAPPQSRIRNQPRARSYGVEIEGRVRLDDRLSATAGLGLLDTEITRTDATNLPAGNRFGFAAPVTLNMGVDWRPVGGLRVDGRVSFVGGYCSDIFNDPTQRGGDYALVDAGVAYDFGR